MAEKATGPFLCSFQFPVDGSAVCRGGLLRRKGGASSSGTLFHYGPMAARRRLCFCGVLFSSLPSETSFDGVRMVVEAAEAAGIKAAAECTRTQFGEGLLGPPKPAEHVQHQDAEKLQKVQEKAEELSPEKQKAGASISSFICLSSRFPRPLLGSCERSLRRPR